MAKRPVNYEQFDPRWANFLYDINPADGPDYLLTAGCGPTCAAMVVATYSNPRITPVEMADFSVKHGYRTKTNGTAWGLFAGVAKAYGIPFLQTGNHGSALSCIGDGGIVACIMGPGRWTKGGHYILWYGCDGGSVFISDPASKAANRAKAPLSDLQAQVRCYFCFWPLVWPALQKLSELEVISSPAYWMAHWDEVKYLDKLIIAGAAKATKAGPPETDIGLAIEKLVERGVIGVPGYWQVNYRAILYLDSLICKLAGSV